MKYLLDANVIIRYLVNDHPRQSAKVESLLKSKKPLFLPDLIVAEIIWVLDSHYGVHKTDIIAQLKALLKLPVIRYNRKLIDRALDNYESYSMDYIDAYLVAYQAVKGFTAIYSFDRDLDKISPNIRCEP